MESMIDLSCVEKTSVLGSNEIVQIIMFSSPQDIYH